MRVWGVDRLNSQGDLIGHTDRLGDCPIRPCVLGEGGGGGVYTGNLARIPDMVFGRAVLCFSAAFGLKTFTCRRHEVITTIDRRETGRAIQCAFWASLK